MEENKETEKEVEELNMKNKPEKEIAVFGLGVFFQKFDKLIKQNEDIINLMRHIENKIESMMTSENEEKLQRIKKRF